MEEYIDILTLNGKLTGNSCPKSIIHKKGHYHNTAHIWFYTLDGQILLQQRSLQKLICPGLWDVSVAGHVDAGETVLQAAVRETQEELGLEICETDLQKIGTFNCFQSYENGIIDNEFHNTFICELKLPLADLKFPEHEVKGIKLVTIDEFRELLENSDNNNHFVSTNLGYYYTVLSEITKKID